MILEDGWFVAFDYSENHASHQKFILAFSDIIQQCFAHSCTVGLFGVLFFLPDHKKRSESNCFINA